MEDAEGASMGRWTRFRIALVDLRGGGTMDDVRIFLARWTMLGARPWDDGRGACIAQADLRGDGTMNDTAFSSPNGRCWARVHGMMDDIQVLPKPISEVGGRWTMLGAPPWDDGRGACLARSF